MLPGSGDAEFRIHYGPVVGSLRIVYTDYKNALVYQCLQQLNDGACLPEQVSVVLLSRKTTMDTRLAKLDTSLSEWKTDLFITKIYIMHHCVAQLTDGIVNDLINVTYF